VKIRTALLAFAVGVTIAAMSAPTVYAANTPTLEVRETQTTGVAVVALSHAAAVPQTSIDKSLLKIVCGAFGGSFFDRGEHYWCEFEGGSVIVCTDDGCWVEFERTGDEPPLREECDRAGGIYATWRRHVLL